MRYALRNQKKIEAAYPGMINRILKSLNKYFVNNSFLPEKDCKIIGNDQYPTLIIDDIGHSVNMIAFYVLERRFNVVRLAFKEFIG